MTSVPFDQAEVRRVASAYPPGARFFPEWERAKHLTPLQQAAWTLRFEPSDTPA